MRNFTIVVGLVLGSVSLTGCGPLTAGTVVDKGFTEAFDETRTREVYKYGCGKHRKMGEIMPKYGCGMGYFNEDYTAHVKDCHFVKLEDADGKTATWCLETGVWEKVQAGDTYVAVETDYKPGTEADS